MAVETLNIDTLADVLAAQPQVNPGLDSPDQPGLCAVYLGFDRHAQGVGSPARTAHQLPAKLLCAIPLEAG